MRSAPQPFEVPYGVCISCTAPTRSHVLEPPAWDTYEQEIIVDQSDEFANKAWEETDVVTRWERTMEPTVICHKCWIKERGKTYGEIEKYSELWTESPMDNMYRIKSFLSKWKKFSFEDSKADEEMNARVKDIRNAIRRGARGN